MSIWGEFIPLVTWLVTFLHGLCVATLYSTGMSDKTCDRHKLKRHWHKTLLARVSTPQNDGLCLYSIIIGGYSWLPCLVFHAKEPGSNPRR